MTTIVKNSRTLEKKETGFVQPSIDRIVEYFGTVNYATSERILGKIKDLIIESRQEEICMLVTSTGGPTGTAMSFYDAIRYVIKPNLITIAAGDVDSSGILIFLAGDKRYVTPHTTLLLHLAGRTFDGGTRFTAHEIEAMLREDKLKDLHYASVVAERSGGHLTTEKVLQLMERNTLLTPPELVSWGLADSIVDRGPELL
jgi:ATP-dependent protease ClpP protease subunit